MFFGVYTYLTQMLTLLDNNQITIDSPWSSFKSFIVTDQNLGNDTLHKIQSEDFTNQGYTFRYMHQDIYLNKLRTTPGYPLYKPIGKPELLSLNDESTLCILNIKWLLNDNPTPNLRCWFTMDFSFEKSRNNDLDKDVISSLDARINISNPTADQTVVKDDHMPQKLLALDEHDPSFAQRYVRKMGYNG